MTHQHMLVNNNKKLDETIFDYDRHFLIIELLIQIIALFLAMLYGFFITIFIVKLFKTRWAATWLFWI
jgi:hypothetical protein